MLSLSNGWHENLTEIYRQDVMLEVLIERCGHMFFKHFRDNDKVSKSDGNYLDHPEIYFYVRI